MHVYCQLFAVLLLPEKILLKRSVPHDERTEPEEDGLERCCYCRGRLGIKKIYLLSRKGFLKKMREEL